MKNVKWHETGNATSTGKYWYADPIESVRIKQPYITTTTVTSPVVQEPFSVRSESDETSRIVYTYLVERESMTPFTIESLSIELMRTISLQKGELLSILVQMVNDGVLSFDRKTAQYTFVQ